MADDSFIRMEGGQLTDEETGNSAKVATSVSGIGDQKEHTLQSVNAPSSGSDSFIKMEGGQITEGITGNRARIATEVSGSGAARRHVLKVVGGTGGGPGTEGPQGRNAGLKYNYIDDTGGGDPANGNVAFNNTDLSLATQLDISNIDFDTNDLGAFLAEQDDSTSETKCYLHMRNDADATQFALFKINGSGTERPAFAVDAGVDLQLGGTGIIHDIAVQPDGKIVLAGDFSGILGESRAYLARLNADKTLDMTFDPVPSAIVRKIVIQDDGKLVVGGFFFTIGGESRFGIARLDSVTGAADSFDPNPDNQIFSLALQSDGKILVGGEFGSIGGETRNFIARIDPTTGLADSWNPDSDAQVRSIVVQSDDQILVGGDFTVIGGQTRNRIARLDVATGLADSFNPDANAAVYRITIQLDGDILVGGHFGTIGGQTRNHIARLDSETGLADSWNPDAGGVSGDVVPIVVQRDGGILVGGHFTTIGGETRNRIARLDPVTGSADSFDPNSDNEIYAIAILPNDDILVGGKFTDIGGHSLTGISIVTALYHTLEIQNLALNNGPFSDNTKVELEFYRTGDAGDAGISPRYRGTSTSSFLIGTGSKVFNVAPVNLFLSYGIGERVRFVSDADPTNWMEGQLTAHTTFTMTVNIDLVHGIGTHADWNLNITGEPGATTDDPTLLAFGALTITANSLTIGTGADTFTQTAFGANTFPARASTGNLVAKTITDFGLSIVDDVDAAAVRTTLGLGTLATQNGTFSGTSSGTNTGDQTITLTGDVTGSGTSSFAATIAAGVVTFAKLATSAWSNDTTLAGDSAVKLVTEHAVKTYADQLIASADVMVFKGVINASANPNYPAADAGHTYRISVAGKIGGASGVNVEIGDLILCLVDGTASGNQATVGANWSVAQTNIDGGVIGPVSANDGNLAFFDGASGKLIKDGGNLNTLGDARWQAKDTDLTSWAAITRAAGFDTFVTTPTSANLLALVTDETGTGALVFATSPTLTTPSVTGLITETLVPGANTVGYGLSLLNNTAATSGNQQYSPALHFRGEFFETTGSTTYPAECVAYVKPIEGDVINDVVGQFVLAWSIGGGALDFPLTYDNIGNLEVPGNIAAVGISADLIAGATVVSGALISAATASVITLTNTSANQQIVTGTSTNTPFKLPLTSQLGIGHSFEFKNQQTGTGTVVVRTSNNSTVVFTLAPGTAAKIICVDNSGATTAASWAVTYWAVIVTTNKKLTVSNNLTLAGTDGMTHTFPATSATIARIDASNTFADAANFIFGTTTGTQIGTATAQKLAFHGSTAVIQRAGAAQAAVATTGATSSTPFGFTTAAQADAIVTLVNELRASLVEKGLIKGAA